MKNNQKYAKLPQDLDLSFQSDLDLLPDTAADIDVDEFNLSGTPPAGLVLNDDDDDVDAGADDDDEDDEIVIAAQVLGGGGGGGNGSGGGSGGGLRLATRKQRKQRKQQQVEQRLYNNKNKICGLGSDSVIEVSPQQLSIAKF
ncbi:PREDICTED: uncharacterized protein LOC108620423 [Drosophila arizonae]|uniref:Uncharacterized protein LOC108620423 n=1 Tax=Drosophila arizonae TaxID=7263 RepID=A0ABM1Q034_DROAR|nr:PREDICTED: uncharacterized protein LOC108620423 [Drosophila arizonae]XP_017872815.1 PREDICTED: uncharacterized protein LOC108620423 [Drosophila arizonae]XP_017872816.1 PREDICTED: uncharacterized protein LOC108620423 [Drosophila arizonae]XP_017872817.1 PREDICTED: uncharacterized protein LOC108620423 [Drosophila arizonae]XP_017872818.1 PREDICTED: uncharacterized protein LOC108620423 [Drosophila arizonae]XP_017872819.1 PREDICTED: uncharacterized protein LOC108620423 [Drosophila arizonae]XP_01